MRGMLQLVALLMIPFVAHAQHGESNDFAEARDATIAVIESIDAALVEYQTVFARRALLEVWLDEERGGNRENGVRPAAHPAAGRATEASTMARNRIQSIEEIGELNDLRAALVERLRELRECILTERRDIQILGGHLETLRNEDVLPLP